MKERDEMTREEILLELAAVEALDSLDQDVGDEERVKLDAKFLAEREELRRAARLLALSARETAPPPGLKDRLRARLAEETGPDSPAGRFFVKDGVFGVRSEDAPWVQSPIPGVTYKDLHHDSARGFTTRLVSIEKGRSYPPHRHGGDEEIFLLQGTLWVNGKLLKAGDYCRSEAGTWEEGTVSETGATAIVVSSDRDDIQLPTT